MIHTKPNAEMKEKGLKKSVKSLPKKSNWIMNLIEIKSLEKSKRIMIKNIKD